MITLLLAVLLVAPAGEELPGTAFAKTREETVLHVGPGGQHAGALTLPAGAVVRVEDVAAAYDLVFVPQGFPIYVHGAFVRVDEAEQIAWLTGDDVNVRVLPAVSGVRPVAQLSASQGALTLLDVEGAWVRVLAPVGVPLYAASEAFTPLGDAEGRAAWDAALARRQERRARRVSFYRATDPGWLALQGARERVVELERADLSSLDQAGLAQLVERARALLAEVEDPTLQSRVQSVQRALDEALATRRAAAAAREQVELERVREMAALAREARYLDFGLRFEGQGEPRTVDGEVVRRTSDTADVAVYSVTDRHTGQRFKLSMAREIGALAPLLGKRVVFAGRQVPIVNVEGAVLVVDEVVRVVDE